MDGWNSSAVVNGHIWSSENPLQLSQTSSSQYPQQHQPLDTSRYGQITDPSYTSLTPWNPAGHWPQEAPFFQFLGFSTTPSTSVTDAGTPHIQGDSYFSALPQGSQGNVSDESQATLFDIQQPTSTLWRPTSSPEELTASSKGFNTLHQYPDGRILQQMHIDHLSGLPFNLQTPPPQSQPSQLHDGRAQRPLYQSTPVHDQGLTLTVDSRSNIQQDLQGFDAPVIHDHALNPVAKALSRTGTPWTHEQSPTPVPESSAHVGYLQPVVPQTHPVAKTSFDVSLTQRSRAPAPMQLPYPSVSPADMPLPLPQLKSTNSDSSQSRPLPEISTSSYHPEPSTGVSLSSNMANRPLPSSMFGSFNSHDTSEATLVHSYTFPDSKPAPEKESKAKQVKQNGIRKAVASIKTQSRPSTSTRKAVDKAQSPAIQLTTGSRKRVRQEKGDNDNVGSNLASGSNLVQRQKRPRYVLQAPKVQKDLNGHDLALNSAVVELFRDIARTYMPLNRVLGCLMACGLCGDKCSQPKITAVRNVPYCLDHLVSTVHSMRQATTIPSRLRALVTEGRYQHRYPMQMLEKQLFTANGTLYLVGFLGFFTIHSRVVKATQEKFYFVEVPMYISWYLDLAAAQGPDPPLPDEEWGPREEICSWDLTNPSPASVLAQLHSFSGVDQVETTSASNSILNISITPSRVGSGTASGVVASGHTPVAVANNELQTSRSSGAPQAAKEVEQGVWDQPGPAVATATAGGIRTVKNPSNLAVEAVEPDNTVNATAEVGELSPLSPILPPLQDASDVLVEADQILNEEVFRSEPLEELLRLEVLPFLVDTLSADT
ncbi:hypothetical protein E1B28_007138 [Marasmius oreades]|uniref:Uncharacterized protein n=1 Tax=Marasmius oreades TaxID=181124 RepID=A0A9P7S177_9AGAR|nr:uncharacterized protein E1B28_007138 [Marasmius oreades]KAG7093462.1 hypothetical protein E1B28_007138 [Marasmius oreades]